MINWAKYFDKIICVFYNKNQKRKQLLEYELKRVGILDSGIFQYFITFQDEYLKLQYKQLQIPYFLSYFSCTSGHIGAIKRAYYSGCKRILLIEDDIRFLKDLNKVEQILQNMPKENQYDLILFDKAPRREEYTYFKNIIKSKENKINKYYFKFTNIILHFSSCYFLNKQGMQDLIQLYDINKCDGSIDHFWNTRNLSMKKAASFTCIAIQCLFKNAGNYQWCLEEHNNDIFQATLALQDCYKIQQVNFNDYMININGNSFNYGDYIEE